MANFTIFADDIKGKHVTFREDGWKFHRLIADIPSFEDRYPGAGSAGDLIDCVNSVIDLMVNCVNKTATISCTGIVQEKFDTWLAGQDQWEVIPNSEWCLFEPYYRSVSTNKHFWGRRDEWTYVRSFRKVGTDTSVPWSRYAGVVRVEDGGENFPMPAARADIEISAFRLPVHKGADESKEHQKWLQKHGIEYTETYIEGRHGDKITGVSDPGRIFAKGAVIAPSDFALYRHVPQRLYNEGNITTNIVQEFNKPTNPGLQNLQTSGDHASVGFYNMLIQTHSDAGDLILDPFAGAGAMAVASVINGRKYVGVEYNADRARGAQLACEEIEKVL